MIKPGDMCIITRALFPGKSQFLGHIVTVTRKSFDTVAQRDVMGWETDPPKIVQDFVFGRLQLIFTDGELTPIPPLTENQDEVDSLDVPA